MMAPVDKLEKPPSSTQILVGVAVMFGWFAAAIVAVVRWVSVQSKVTPEGEDCSGWCTSDFFDAAGMAIVLGVPAGGVALIVGAIVLALLTQRVRYGLLSGTVAGLAGLLAGPAIVYCVMSAWGG
jgi:hypothetical protein